MPWIKPDAQDLMIWPISALPCRDIILAQMSISLISKKTETSWTTESSQSIRPNGKWWRQRDEEDPLHDPAGPWDYGDQYYPDHVLRYYHTSSGLKHPDQMSFFNFSKFFKKTFDNYKYLVIYVLSMRETSLQKTHAIVA